MTKEEYLSIRNTNHISSDILFNTLLLNPTFKIKDLNEFHNYLNLISIIPNSNNILLSEFVRLNDIKYNVITIYDKNNNEIKQY